MWRHRAAVWLRRVKSAVVAAVQRGKADEDENCAERDTDPAAVRQPGVLQESADGTAADEHRRDGDETEEQSRHEISFDWIGGHTIVFSTRKDNHSARNPMCRDRTIGAADTEWRMQAVRYHDHGGTDVLAVEAVERPEPDDDDEVLVEVGAAAVNPVDTYFRDGSYEPATLPWIPGSDVAGTVAAVGDDVTGFAVGDRVFGTGLGNQLPGTCAEYVAAPTGMLAHLPDAVGFETGAATALVGVTAWQTLVEACSLHPADTCLIHGGSGGVGHVAVQLAAATGATVTATASPQYHDRLQDLGADAVFDYRREDLADAIVDAGEPDAVLDHRLDEYLPLDADVAAQGADIGAIGNESLSATFENVPQCRGKALSVHHVSMFNTPDVGAVCARLGTLMADGDLAGLVARRYDLDDVARAHRAVLEDSYLGKLVVVP